MLRNVKIFNLAYIQFFGNMEDIDPSFFLNLLSSNNIDEIATGLFALLEMIDSSNDSLLYKIPYHNIYLSLISILCNQKEEELLNNATRCIVRSDIYLNSKSKSSINIENPSQILQSIFNHLSKPEFKSLTKVHILNALFHLIPNCLNQNAIFDFSKFTLFETVKLHFGQFDRQTERYFVKMLSHLWSFFEQFRQYQNSLFNSQICIEFLFYIKSKISANESADTVSQLIFDIMYSYHIFIEGKDCLKLILNQAKKSDKSKITAIFQLINHYYCAFPERKSSIIQGKKKIDFMSFFKDSNSMVYTEFLLAFSMMFLPRPNLPSIDQLFEGPLFQWCIEKCDETFIKEHCEKMIITTTKLYSDDRNDQIKLSVLKALSVFSSFIEYNPDFSILYKLAFDAKEEEYPFYVAIIVSNLNEEKKKLIFRTDIFNTLQCHQFESEALNSSYIEYLNNNVGYEEQTLPDEILCPDSLSNIISAISNKKLFMFDFLSDSNDLFEIIWELLPTSRRGDLEQLVDFIYNEGLNILSLPKSPKDPFPVDDYRDIVEKSIRLIFGLKVCNAEMYAPLLYTEMILNEEYQENIVQMECKDNPEFKRMFHDFDQVFHGRYSMSVIAEVIKIEGFKYYVYKIDDKWIDPYDYFLKSLLNIIDDPADIFKPKKSACFEKTNSIQVSYLQKIQERMNKNEMIPNMNQFITNLFELLNEIYSQDSTINMINNEFVSKMVKELSSPILTIGVFSPCTRMMIKYPFLFPFEDRFFFYKVLTSELSIVANLYLQRFKKEKPVNKPSHTWHMKVSRDNLFDEGNEILKKFGKYKIFLEFSFSGETGVGTGPNREFFNLMSKEFCLKKRGMWRTEETNDDYAYSEKGLFPICTGKDELFYLLGIFVAKALQMDIYIDIPFNPSFFDLIFDKKIELKEIDEKYSTFSEPTNLYGLTFVYPIHDQEEIDMIDDGKNIEVNESNVNKYIELFNEFTIGSKIKSKLNAFVNGFNEIMDINTLNIFSGVEINRIICGDDFNLSHEALKKYVKIGNGFSPGSDQIRFFFEIILEMNYNEKIMFLNFITGSSRLPIGGLAAIYPPLTIARRVLDNPYMTDDDPLPTVLTCTHYFKLPAYSNKEIMREKLMKAVMEGRENFTQT